MIKSNPFFTSIFVNIWHKHFDKANVKYTFSFIKSISFFKPTRLPIFINSGKNLTKGVSYILNGKVKGEDFKKKCFLIYDVPEFFEIDTSNNIEGLRQKKIKQYSGFSINLEKYGNFDNYLKSSFSKSSIQKFRRYNRRLEKCFNITYKMYYGDIDKKEYDFIFTHFNKLLTKRFNDKKITNNNLNSNEWSFYEEVVFPLILEKKASLFVIYSDDTPITVRLNYYSEDVVFDAITVFDIDYSKFHIGKTSIIKMLEWCFDKQFKIFDFSKGFYDYKKSWSDLKYAFEYHIYYDSKSTFTTLIATSLFVFFKLKQFFRNQNINYYLHKITFLFKKPSSKLNTDYSIKLMEQNFDFAKETIQKIDIKSTDNSLLRKIVFDFLFTSSENLQNISLYKNNDELNNYILQDNKANYIIAIGK